MRDCSRTSRQQTRIRLSPRPPGANIARAPHSEPPSCRGIRNVNIIPSGLCNSRRHPQCPASRVSEKHTPRASSSILQGVRLHNPDYVKLLRQKHLPPFSLVPGRVGGRKGAGCSGRLAPGPLPAPHRAAQLGPNFPNCSAPVPPRIPASRFIGHHPHSASVLREHPAALCPSGGSQSL